MQEKTFETLFSEATQDYTEYLSGLKVIANSAENDYTGLEKEDISNAINVIVRKMENTNKILNKCFDLAMEKRFEYNEKDCSNDNKNTLEEIVKK